MKIVQSPDNRPKAINIVTQVATGEVKKILAESALLIKPDALQKIVNETKTWSLCGYVLNGVMIEPQLSSVFSGSPRSFCISYRGAAPAFDETLPCLWTSDWARRMMKLHGQPAIGKGSLVLGVPKQQEDFREMAKVWRRWEGKTPEERGEVPVKCK